jgi:hypothetical protein
VLLFLIAAQVPHFNFSFVSIGSGVSAVLFLDLMYDRYCTSGLMVCVHRWIKARRKRSQRERLVEVKDDGATALKKRYSARAPTLGLLPSLREIRRDLSAR